MTKITDQDLKSILWKDISIQKLPNGQHILILICDTTDQSNRLMDMLKNNEFDLNITINKDKHYILSLAFLNSEYTIGYNTNETKENYPPLDWLAKSLVKYISTGIWVSKGFSEYRQDIHPLDSINMN